MREAVFDGFHRSLAAYAAAGNNLLVEHILERQRWVDDLRDLLTTIDLFTVSLHCPLEVLETREKQRGDRRIGEAKSDFGCCNSLCEFDLVLDSTQPAAANAQVLLEAWLARDTHQLSRFRPLSN